MKAGLRADLQDEYIILNLLFPENSVILVMQKQLLEI